MARPKVLSDDTVRVEAKIPADHAAALEAVALVTGEAQASHVRRAVAWYLADYNLNAPDAATSVVSRLTTESK